MSHSPKSSTQTEALDAETKLWSELPVDAWKQSVLTEDSVFHDLYLDTRRRLVEAVNTHKYDVIVEVGCGTGEVIAHLEEAGVPRIGVDINETFVEHCRTVYKEQADLEFFTCNATLLDEWWEKMGYASQFAAPLLVCPNNTLMIMPENIRESVLQKMRAVAGPEGRCVVTFWNKKLFAHGVMGFYKKNRDLCGHFDLTPEHVDWEGGTIETKTSYKSEWLSTDDVVRWMSSLLIDVETADPHRRETPEVDHVAEHGMGVYLWLKGTAPKESATGSARDYYDSRDAQTFYSTVWGENNTHLGRYDLVESDPSNAALDLKERIRLAQVLQERALIEFISKFYAGVKVRCLDMGCGYGGFLRSMSANGMLWSGIGVDISGRMIDSARRLTESMTDEAAASVLTFYRESYMNTSVGNEGVDLVVSMDAFLHVGPGQHDSILREAWRVLRPGGRLIFTDIMARPDAPPEAKVLYDRLGLQAMGTVPGYFDKAKNYGFGELTFEEHSEQISKHYGSVHDVLETMWAENEINVTAEFKDHMTAGLVKWRDLAPTCLQWGIVSMRKLEMVSDEDDSR